MARRRQSVDNAVQFRVGAERAEADAMHQLAAWQHTLGHANRRRHESAQLVRPRRRLGARPECADLQEGLAAGGHHERLQRRRRCLARSAVGGSFRSVHAVAVLARCHANATIARVPQDANEGPQRFLRWHRANAHAVQSALLGDAHRVLGDAPQAIRQRVRLRRRRIGGHLHKGSIGFMDEEAGELAGRWRERRHVRIGHRRWGRRLRRRRWRLNGWRWRLRWRSGWRRVLTTTRAGGARRRGRVSRWRIRQAFGGLFKAGHGAFDPIRGGLQFPFGRRAGNGRGLRLPSRSAAEVGSVGGCHLLGKQLERPGQIAAQVLIAGKPLHRLLHQRHRGAQVPAQEQREPHSVEAVRDVFVGCRFLRIRQARETALRMLQLAGVQCGPAVVE